MIRILLSALFPGGKAAKLPTLIFHRVLAKPDELFPDEVDVVRFKQICVWLKRWFHVLPLDQAVELLEAGRLPARAVCITFDDGYADNHDLAMPILRALGLPATFFIATAYLNGGRMWNDSVIESIRRCSAPELNLDDLVEGLSLGRYVLGSPQQRRSAIDQVLRQIKYLEPSQRLLLTEKLAERAQVKLPNDLMMSSEQVKAMHAAGMQIGAHTATHPILARLDAQAARLEILSSKQRLEALLQAPVPLFAYPNGQPGLDYTPETAAVVKSLGFHAAVSTAWGAADSRQFDLMQLPRFTPWDRSAWRFLLRMWRNAFRQEVVTV